jgi:exodeoxyribonuclease-5
MTATDQILAHFASNLGLTPNQGQADALKALAGFVAPDNTGTCFILTGPAGSGKTSLLRSLISWFVDCDIDFSLSAPTGRAAQIAGKKTQTHASTLHSLLFKVHVQDDPLQISFVPKTNNCHEDIRFYLVDEASMISDNPTREGMFVQNLSVLEQLFRFVKQGNPRNKIIFIGDQFQLPPVNCTFSPALSPEYLKKKYQVNLSFKSLTTVERTQNDSYVFNNAMSILDSIGSNKTVPDLSVTNVSSFSSGIKKYLEDFCEDPYNQGIMIALANTQVNALNTWARKFRFQYNDKDAVKPGEWMVCNSNAEIDEHILFKGNHFKVINSWKPEEFAGLQFVNAEIEFENLDNVRVRTRTKILLDSVLSTDGAIPYEKEKALVHEAYRRNRKFRESKRTSDDAFVSALRARYGYALTCHKAQGGEWNNVYLHPGYRKDDMRWLYTAVTRAVTDIYSWKN